MFATPASVLGTWLRGLIAIGALSAGCWLVYQWYSSPHRQNVREPGERQLENADDDRQSMTRSWRLGFDGPTAYLLCGVTLLGWSVLGRFTYPRLLRRSDATGVPKLPTGRVIPIPQANGHLHAEVHGNETGPTLIVTHGWGMDSQEWAYLHRQLGDQFRVVTWDLPGIGKSVRPPNNDYSLERMAANLRQVIDQTSSDRPVVLVGHSIGGMIILTFCRMFPELLGDPVSRLVLIHTTYTNPLATIRWAKLATALQKPLIEPLLQLQIVLSPLVWLMNWLSYWNGSAHRSASRTSLAGTETRSQLDFVASFQPRHSPAVLARGALAMLRYDATEVLERISVPTLVISGDRDPVTTPDANERISQRIRTARLEKLTPAKHCGHIEHDRDFAELVSSFCRSGTARASALSF